MNDQRKLVFCDVSGTPRSVYYRVHKGKSVAEGPYTSPPLPMKSAKIVKVDEEGNARVLQ